MLVKGMHFVNMIKAAKSANKFDRKDMGDEDDIFRKNNATCIGII